MKTTKKTSKKQILENFLLNEIHNGTYKIGDLIPSENELVKKFGFGRQTVHNVLYDLALKGIITRRKGKGSFVAYKPVNRNIQRKMSFSEDMKNIGMIAGAKLLEYKIIIGADIPEIMKDLAISENEEVYYIKRLRTGNNLPIAIQYYYIPTKFFPSLDIGLLVGSIDEYVANNGYEIVGFITRLRAITGTNEDIILLDTKQKSLLQSISIRYITNNVPLQYTITHYCSDLYEYTFSSFSK